MRERKRENINTVYIPSVGSDFFDKLDVSLPLQHIGMLEQPVCQQQQLDGLVLFVRPRYVLGAVECPRGLSRHLQRK